MNEFWAKNSQWFFFFFFYFSKQDRRAIESNCHSIILLHCLLSHIPFHLRFGVAFQALLRSDKIVLVLIPSLRWKATKLKDVKKKKKKKRKTEDRNKTRRSSVLPVVGCLLEDDERDEREVVFEPRARHPPCWDASECLFNRKPSRAAGEFLYQSGTFSRCRDLCTLSSCSLGTRSPTFCNSFSGGWKSKKIFFFLIDK